MFGSQRVSKHILLPAATQLGVRLLRLAGFSGLSSRCFLFFSFSVALRTEQGFIPFLHCYSSVQIRSSLYSVPILINPFSQKFALIITNPITNPKPTLMRFSHKLGIATKRGIWAWHSGIFKLGVPKAASNQKQKSQGYPRPRVILTNCCVGIRFSGAWVSRLGMDFVLQDCPISGLTDDFS